MTADRRDTSGVTPLAVASTETVWNMVAASRWICEPRGGAGMGIYEMKQDFGGPSDHRSVKTKRRIWSYRAIGDIEKVGLA
jgi:hypothetical protein